MHPLPCLLGEELPSRSATPHHPGHQDREGPSQAEPAIRRAAAHGRGSAVEQTSKAGGMVRSPFWDSPGPAVSGAAKNSPVARPLVAPTAHARLGPAGGSTCPRSRLSCRPRAGSSEASGAGLWRKTFGARSATQVQVPELAQGHVQKLENVVSESSRLPALFLFCFSKYGWGSGGTSQN